jgi:hypothetical protein
VVDTLLVAPAAGSLGSPFTLRAKVRLLAIASIRTDGDAQHRIAPDPNIIQEYAELMRAGVEFPPISVRYDGADYWPSDGFQRLAAAKLAEFLEMKADVLPGTREEAQWDSYAANATHGLRRTAVETEEVLKLALRHPNAANLTDASISEHVHVPRSTVQYWRKKLSCQSWQDTCTRTVTRGNTTYEMDVTGIGKKENERRTKPRREMQQEITQMRASASIPARDLLNVIEKWARGQVPPARCLELIEGILHRQCAQTATNSATAQAVN